MAANATPLTGSAPIQGKLWGAQAQDWAQIQEQAHLPLYGAALDAARVTRGTRLLDAGSGAGLASLLASLRGATVSAIDASAALMAIGRGRMPDCDARQADLESMPYDDATFDAVIAVNSLFYAADPAAAMRELARVVRPGGRVVATTWGPAERCEYAAAIGLLGALMPPPPPGSTPGGPFALAAPGALEAAMGAAGLHPVERGETACPFRYPDGAVSLRGQLSSGVAQRAIGHSGEEQVRAAIAAADARFTQPDGGIRYENTFVWVAAVR